MTFKDEASGIVLSGGYIPAHDRTFDLAEDIGTQLDAFRQYVTNVREAEQADNAVRELLQRFLEYAVRESRG